MAQNKILIKKKKKWYKINASKEFKNVFIGESLLDDLNQLIGKSIEVNLMLLTNDPKKQNFKIRFRVKEVKDNEAQTDMESYTALPSYIKRAIRPGKSKIEDTCKLKSKDNLDVVCKLFFITKSIVSNSIKTNLRKKSREFLINYGKGNNYSDIVQGLLNGSLQKDLRSILNKIYPLTTCIVRVFEKK